MTEYQSQLGLGSGIYSYSEAARLLKVSTQKVRRWAEGYVYARQGEVVSQSPILQGKHNQQGLLNFQDLIELMFVREFRAAGVALKEIRAAAELLSEKLCTAHPFAHQKLSTDGKQLLMDAPAGFVNVVIMQNVFQFAEELFKDIVFDNNVAKSWKPLGSNEPILVDPHRSFGAPIEESRGIRTDVIYSTFKAENDEQAVAEWYKIPAESVRAAVRFEEQWQRKAA